MIKKGEKRTWLRGKMSAMSFLYLLTGCLDLARNAGQKKQRPPQAGKTWRESTPETALIFEFKIHTIHFTQIWKWAPHKLAFLSLPNLWGKLWVQRRERKAQKLRWVSLKLYKNQPEINKIPKSQTSKTNQNLKNNAMPKWVQNSTKRVPRENPKLITNLINLYRI